MKSNSSCMLGLAAGLFSLGSLVALPAESKAQRQGPSVTVQLPEFHYFGVETTVLVPDRGSAYMGGIGRSSSGQTTQAAAPLIPFKNRGMGQSVGAASTTIGAWVHDFQAMDKAVLTEAQRRNGDDGVVRHGTEFRKCSHWPDLVREREANSAPDNTLVSTDEHAIRQTAKQDAEQAEAQKQFEKAQALMAEGKPGVARIYFQMALRRAEGPLKAEIAAAQRASRGPQVAAESK